MASKDVTEKLLESYDDVFADIVNVLLFQGRRVVAPDALTDAQANSFYKGEDRIHEQERDVAKYWRKGAVRFALLGFENQSKYDRLMPLRCIGYDGANYRAELNARLTYPVITIVLYFGKERWKNRTLYDVLNPPEELKPYVSDYRINVFEIAYLTDEQIAMFQSDFQVVADYVAHSRVNPDYTPVNPKRFEHAFALLKLMSAITGDERFEEEIDEKGGAPKDMCEVLQRVEERGIAQGMDTGRLEQAKADALRIREELGMQDAKRIAHIVNVETELVERWLSQTDNLQRNQAN